MKHRRLFLIATAILFFGAVCSVRWLTKPVQVRFSGLRAEQGKLFAVFEIENRSEHTMNFEENVTVHGDVQGYGFTRAGLWSPRDPYSDLHIHPGETANLKIPLKSSAPEYAGPVAPFRIELSVRNLRSTIWIKPPLEWLPDRFKPPISGTVWSERVVP